MLSNRRRQIFSSKTHVFVALLFAALMSAAFSQKSGIVAMRAFTIKTTGWGYIEQTGANSLIIKVLKLDAIKSRYKYPRAYIYSGAGRYETRVIKTKRGQGKTLFIVSVPHYLRFKPGKFVKVDIVLDEKKYLAVPVSAIVENSKFQYVGKVRSGKPVAFVPIRVRHIQNGYAAVVPLRKSTLKAGDKVLIEGAYEIFHKKIAEEVKIAD